MVFYQTLALPGLTIQFSGQSGCDADCAMKVVRIDLDIAQSVFQVHGVNQHGKVVL